MNGFNFSSAEAVAPDDTTAFLVPRFFLKCVGDDAVEIDVRVSHQSLQASPGDISVVSWDGIGDLRFSAWDGSASINGANTNILFTGGVKPVLASEHSIFLVFYVKDKIFIERFWPSNSHLQQVQDPNMQMDEATGVLDCGHEAGDGRLFLACTQGQAAPTMAADSIALGDVVGALSAEAVVVGQSAGAVAANGVVVGKAAGAVSADGISIGTSAAAIGANAISIGDTVGALSANAICVGTAGSTLAANSVVVGNATLAVAADAVVVGGATGTVAAGAVVVGDVTGTVAANEIVLGSGAAVNQAGITLPALAGVAHVAADSTHSLQVSIGGVTYYVMLTTVAP